MVPWANNMATWGCPATRLCFQILVKNGALQPKEFASRSWGCPAQMIFACIKACQPYIYIHIYIFYIYIYICIYMYIVCISYMYIYIYEYLYNIHIYMCLFIGLSFFLSCILNICTYLMKIVCVYTCVTTYVCICRYYVHTSTH